MPRGLLIVFEGGDKCGKTRQCRMLVEAFEKRQKIKYIKFPDRTSGTGRLIDRYLTGKEEMEDHAIHLLFAANRWEAEKSLREDLLSGTTLVVDRYAYSGVAYSAAKNKPGMDLNWCMQVEIGLPKPDLVIFLRLHTTSALGRDGFGAERYESVDFQRLVLENFARLCKEQCDSKSVIKFDAARPPAELHEEIKALVLPHLLACESKPIETLW